MKEIVDELSKIAESSNKNNLRSGEFKHASAHSKGSELDDSYEESERLIRQLEMDSSIFNALNTQTERRGRYINTNGL